VVIGPWSECRSGHDGLEPGEYPERRYVWTMGILIIGLNWRGAAYVEGFDVGAL
jgi:hypothetical protein